MVLIPHNVTDDAVLDIIHKWIDVLAREDYEAAVSELGPGLAFAYGFFHQKRNVCVLKLKDTFHRNIFPKSRTSSSLIGVWRKVEIQNLDVM
jgi:hypothetical protein